jgi:DtxR family Mn-dependent transcriptional regulator
MVDPFTALIISGLTTLLAALFFWPAKGLFWQFRSGKLNTERVLLEDALKQLFDHEYRAKDSTLRSISGALQQNMDKTTHILNKLIAMDLVVFKDSQFHLTPEGKKYALRVIRTHRLWERYLADETGLNEKDWHREAEYREHTTSPDQAEEIASIIGFPSFDPHGDPIPTVSGEIPPRKGTSLANLDVGNNAVIIHIEDEPEAIYAQLVAEGLYPGMHLNVIEKTNQKIIFVADGEEIVLAPVVAHNISVDLIHEKQKSDQSLESLSDLASGESAQVISISKACRGMQRRRLMDLGIIPGTEIKAEFASASANPVAYNIRGALIALREDQAHFIKVKRV